jgi:hypothetical protein
MSYEQIPESIISALDAIPQNVLESYLDHRKGKASQGGKVTV